MTEDITPITNKLFNDIASIIEQAKQKVSVYLNMETTLLYWNIGDFLFRELKQKNQLQYGKQILATLSQELSWNHLEFIFPHNIKEQTDGLMNEIEN